MTRATAAMSGRKHALVPSAHSFFFARSSPHALSSPPTLPQQNLLGSLGLTPPATIQLDLRGPDGRPPPTVGGGKSGSGAGASPSSTTSTSDAGLVAEAGGEAMPLYTNHATVAGQVR